MRKRDGREVLEQERMSLAAGLFVEYETGSTHIKNIGWVESMDIGEESIIIDVPLALTHDGSNLAILDQPLCFNVNPEGLEVIVRGAKSEFYFSSPEKEFRIYRESMLIFPELYGSVDGLKKYRDHLKSARLITVG